MDRRPFIGPKILVYKSVPSSMNLPKQRIIQLNLSISFPKNIFNMPHPIHEEHPLHKQPHQSLNSTEKPSDVQDDASQFPTGAKLGVIVISILFAMFLVALVRILLFDILSFN